MQSVLKKLQPLINNENTSTGFREYSLDNIKYLLKHYGNPHEKIKTIHIAGTNGKGSTAYMLNSILSHAGYKTGLYTSPHLLKINERIKVNNRNISESKLHDYIDDFFNLINKQGIYPTFFDALTLFAFRYFYDNGVDIAVIETGLGGRLDTTNIINPLLSIITDISYDHMYILGNTIRDIAFEKSGIIKPGIPVITSNTKKEILNIITDKARESKSRLFALNRDFSIRVPKSLKSGSFDFCLDKNHNRHAVKNMYSIKNVKLSQPGKFQQKNASLAILSSLILYNSGFKIEENDIRKGLANIAIPGRLQIISVNPLILFDPAHNPEALKAIIPSIKKIYPGKNYIAVVAFMKDKDCLSMFKILKDLTENIIYCRIKDSRAFQLPSENSIDINSPFRNINTAAGVKEITDILLKSKINNPLFLFTGSFRLYKTVHKVSTLLKNKFPS